TPKLLQARLSPNLTLPRNPRAHFIQQTGPLIKLKRRFFDPFRSFAANSTLNPLNLPALSFVIV
ncbi:hypothetical protein, partial [Idiomarina sp.]|uniref:hypothetical protein n=1 Tax=Idiomarina sp. TaxID=1874361 RepID=UPI0025C2DBA4